MPFTSPLAGKWFDCYGPHLPIAIGSGLHVFGLLMASLSHKYYQFTLSQSVMSGIGSSLIFIPAMSAELPLTKLPRMQPQTWFRQKGQSLVVWR
ncbi:hypothetical protein V6Z79_006187 [Aspergillus fumigatus]